MAKTNKYLENVNARLILNSISIRLTSFERKCDGLIIMICIVIW